MASFGLLVSDNLVKLPAFNNLQVKNKYLNTDKTKDFKKDIVSN